MNLTTRKPCTVNFHSSARVRQSSGACSVRDSSASGPEKYSELRSHGFGLAKLARGRGAPSTVLLHELVLYWWQEVILRKLFFQ